MINNILVGKNLLETITSALYEDPIVLFREYVQNSVDAYKKAIKEDKKTKIDDFHISIKIDETNKQIEIKDNGYGIYTNEEFKQKMINIAMSDKADRSQYIGFRGIGRLSAMPFCKTLKFINKAKGSSQLDICTWEGSKYRELLNSDAKDYKTFEGIVNNIVNTVTEVSEDDVDTHFFKVIIEGYGQEIEDIIVSVNFKTRLRKMLPLKYSHEFTNASKIIEKYNAFMAEDFNDFAYSVKLNDEELLKNYKDSKHVLESDIVFWEIRGKKGPANRPGKKIGILWFTFNKKLTASTDKEDTDYGILVRSKNVLMGNNDTFADLCENGRERISTHRELTQLLRSVYGELLINNSDLKDNARREWFKTDDNSYYLRGIIIDFVKRLHSYRYKASKYYNNKGVENKKNLKDALVDLVAVDTNKIDVNSFYDTEPPKEKPSKNENCEESSYLFADEDIPRQSKTLKKNYEELMQVIKVFFEKENKYDLFLKLRAYIKKHYLNRI